MVWRRLGSVRLLRNSFLSGIANLGTVPWLSMAGSLHRQLLGFPAQSLFRAGVAASSLAHPGAASPNQPRSWPSLASLSGCWYRVALKMKLPHTEQALTAKQMLTGWPQNVSLRARAVAPVQACRMGGRSCRYLWAEALTSQAVERAVVTETVQ